SQVGPQYARNRRLVLVPCIDRAAKVQVSEQEPFLLVIERLEIEEGHDVLKVAVRLERISLSVERSHRVFETIVEQDAPAHEAEATITLEITGVERPFRREQVPDVDTVPLISERRFVASQAKLEAR